MAWSSAVRRLLLACFASVLVTTVVAGSPASSAPVAKQTTKIVVKVKHCDGCRVRLANHNFAAVVNVVDFGEKKVRRGKVAFRVPRPYVEGFVFSVRDPRATGANYEEIAVVRYAGKKTGKKVSAKAARRAKRAYPCWAGSSKRKVTLHLTVDRFTGKAIDGRKATFLRAYFSPGLRPFGAKSDTWHGVLGTQYPFSCYSPI